MERLMLQKYKKQRKSWNTIHIFCKQTKQVNFKCGFVTKSNREKDGKNKE